MRWKYGAVLMLALPLADAAHAQQPAAIPVGIVRAERRPITQGANFVGRVQAMQRVELRARVTGFLERVAFTEGQTVQEGAELFLIEQAPFTATVHGAEAAVQKAAAEFRNATLQRQRADELVRTNAIPVATRDQRVAEEGMAQANVAAAQATLESARIDLGYTVISAPIAGRIGRTALTKGNVVGPDSGVLALIVSQDPVYVTFPVSQRQMLALQRHGTTASVMNTTQLRIRFSDGTDYGQTGHIDFVDVTVDRATDTISVRGVIPNPDGVLVDGQYVTVAVEAEQPQERVIIPQAALIADQEGTYVFVVEQDKAVVRRVRLGTAQSIGAVIEQGLEGGEAVIVDGIQRIRPGQTVHAAPAQRLGQGG